ncbi:hypothetical protein [Massilia glaciei]|uniref:DUF3617 domain-containing protein n=1 Tax=Massilia glaciei TaxID=1524097 RepID=A0A2U2HGV4_9BURK|nr:hypothetical protein [Massilia glaciei]PWF44656.1 hypothetical protein C7C56_019150 [Massilia glaciei]
MRIQTVLRATCLLAPVALVACAGMDEFMGGMSQGMEQQRIYHMTPAQKEQMRVNQLPLPPAPNLNAKGVIYRCTTGKITSDNKITATDWLVSPPGYYQWTSRNCNVGEHRTRMGGSSKTTCQLGYNPTSMTTSNHSFGFTWVKESINLRTMQYQADSNLEKGGQKLRGSCKVID